MRLTPAPFRSSLADGRSFDPHTAIFPILKEVRPGETRLVGTGFFLTTIGHFVTNKHVIMDVFDSSSGQQRGFLHALHFVRGSEVLVRHITNVCCHDSSDLAVGKMDYHVLIDTGQPLKNAVPRFTTDIPSLGSTVITFSYPESDREFRHGESATLRPNCYSGEFKAHCEQARDKTLVTFPHFVSSTTLIGGASGGPVFDDKGRVFAVHSVGGMPDLSYAARIIDLLVLLVPEFSSTGQDLTVADLAKSKQIIFEPAID